MKQGLSVLVRNSPGVLTRVAGLFTRRAFNIESLAVGITDSPDYSRITIVVPEDKAMVEQICKQLAKLEDVLKVETLEPKESVARDLALIKVKSAGARSEIIELVEIFRANIVDVSLETVTVEIAGGANKIDALFDLLKPYGIVEIVRSGTIALARGTRTIYDNIESEE